jgi:hypothetical protein
MMRWRITKILLGFCLLAVITGPESSSAMGLSYADNQVFPHGYVDFNVIDPLAMTDYPFASAGRRIVFQTSYRSLYNMKELTDNRMALAHKYRHFDLGLAFASFGEPDYFHQTGLSSFASYRRGQCSLGGALLYSRVAFSAKYDYLSVILFNLGGAYYYNDITVYAVTRSFNQPRYYPTDRTVVPEAEIGVSYKSREGLDSQVGALFVRFERPTAQLTQAFRLNEYARLNWALVLLPARFGGGLRLEKGHFVFDYKISHHPVLGLTHTVMLTVF